MRKAYLDNLRTATVLAVVLYHVLYMYNAQGILGGLGKITRMPVQYQDIYLYLVYPWCMPLLFLVSGASARYALEKYGTRTFLQKRTAKLLVPSAVGPFVFWPLQGYISLSLADAWGQLRQVPAQGLYLILALSGISVLWYLQVLWLLSVLLAALRTWERDRLWHLGAKAGMPVLAALAVPVWAAAQLFNTPVVVVYRFGLYGAVFLAGYFLLSHDAVVVVLQRWCWPLLAVTAVLGLAFCLRFFGQGYATAPIDRTPLFVGYAWFGSLALFGGMARYGDRATPLTRWLHQRSFGVYLCHYLGISAAALWLGKPGRLPPALVYAASLLAGLATGYGLPVLLRRIPFLRWAVLGIGPTQEKSDV